MKFGTEVGLDPGHIMLDGDPAPPPQKGYSPQFWPMSIVVKRLDGLGCPGHIVLERDPAAPSKGAQPPPPIFGPCLLRPNGRPYQLLLSTCCSVCSSIFPQTVGDSVHTARRNETRQSRRRPRCELGIMRSPIPAICYFLYKVIWLDKTRSEVVCSCRTPI